MPLSVYFPKITLKYETPALDSLLFCYSLTAARFSVSGKSSLTGTTIRAASILTIGIDAHTGIEALHSSTSKNRNAHRISKLN